MILAACALLVAQVVTADARPIRALQHRAPVTISASCKTSRTAVLATDELSEVASVDWLALPNGAISFTSKRLGCVIVTLSAVVYSEADTLFVQMLLDGTTACGPAYGLDWASSFAGPNTLNTAASMTYFCNGVPPGSHTVEAEYATRLGNAVDVVSHTLIVSHN